MSEQNFDSDAKWMRRIYREFARKEWEQRAKEYGMAYVELAKFTPDLNALQAVPQHVANNLNVLPLRLRDNCLYVAVSNPNDMSVMDELRLVARRTIKPVLAAPEHISEAINPSCYLKPCSRYGVLQTTVSA